METISEKQFDLKGGKKKKKEIIEKKVRKGRVETY